MLTRFRVLGAFLTMVVFSSLVTGTQAQGPESAREQYCGRSSCRELAQVLTTAVTAATNQFEASRSRLRPHEVHLKGPFSRFVAFIKAMLGASKQKPKQKPEDTQRIQGTGSQPPVQPDTVWVYNAHEVERLRSSTKKTLIKGLRKNPDFYPYIESVEKHFPVTPSTTQIRGVARVDRDEGDSWFDKVLSFLSGLIAKGPGPVDLQFTSIPESGANIFLNVSPLPNGSWYKRDTVTKGSIPGLVRGIYSYEVKKDGFKTGEGSLDLLDDTRENVECHLQRPTSSQETACPRK